MISAVSVFVSQNYGAGNRKRIRQGVRVGLIQTQALNVLMGVEILLLREPIVALFIEHPTKKIIVSVSYTHLSVMRTSRRLWRSPRDLKLWDTTSTQPKELPVR